MNDNLVTCLWFDTDGEEAARFYTSVFPNSKLGKITRYGSAGPREEGTVMTVGFELMGQEFIALNGGPQYSFSEAISFQVLCESQEEVDRYWETLSAGGEQGLAGRQPAPGRNPGVELTDCNFTMRRDKSFADDLVV